jgi:hypothetical protein
MERSARYMSDRFILMHYHRICLAALAKNRIEMFVIFSIRIITLNKSPFFLMIS